MTISTAAQMHAAVAERWAAHLLPATIHTLHRAAIGYCDPNNWDVDPLPGLDRIADALDALVPAFCTVMTGPRGNSPITPAMMAKATASSMLQCLIKAVSERVPAGPWAPAHSSLASMRGYEQDRYLSSFEQWAITAGTAEGDRLTAWGTDALAAQAVIAGTSPKPSFDEAFAHATTLLPGTVPA